MEDSYCIAIIKKGLEMGREIGRKERFIEDEIIRSKKRIFSCLSIRFSSVPCDIQDSVNSYSDLTALDSLFQRSLDCKSLDEFRENFVR
jgi:hypothetical protein